ncbi:MAG: nucleotidyltransferase family protein [Ruminococcaceae bacterium]|nr:nucleotidyltransferase family protein [Oscillospiraceae bacterium]
MSDFGLICEVNPLHEGHAYLLREARRLGAERIVCVMSGNTVQRGEFAVVDAYARAEALVRCGADLVLELPFPYCSGSAESFARGGVSIAGQFCDTLIFGSECGDIERLRRCAEAAGSAEFRSAYRAALERGEPAAAAYDRMIGERVEGCLGSNDRLGVEYLRAAAELGVPLRALTVKRRGAEYGQETLCEESYASALAIRRLWREGRYKEAERYLPREAAEVFCRVREEGLMPQEAILSAALVSFFRLYEGADFSGIVGTEGGLANRICRAAREAGSAEELMARIRTKRYTDSHLRRVMLYCLAGVYPEDLEAPPAYTTLLAANERGRALLAERRRTPTVRVVTKPADAPADTRQYAMARRLDAVVTLAQGRSADAFLKCRPYRADDEKKD